MISFIFGVFLTPDAHSSSIIVAVLDFTAFKADL